MNWTGGTMTPFSIESMSQISLPPVYTEKIFKSLLERLGSEKNTYQQEIHDCK